MTPEELRQCLKDEGAISQQPFVLLKEISRLLNLGEESVARDAILRALEHRDAFGEYCMILDSLVRETGLFPYVHLDDLSVVDMIAYEYHRPEKYDQEFVFHREQAEIYRRLIDGDNIILSAPTSFGKSKVLDAIVASGRYKNIVLIVPTIALIDETRRRMVRFAPEFKIVTQVSQIPEERNVFIFTAERANIYEHFPHIDFFAIDEFYKIGALEEDQQRTVALNHCFYKLCRNGAQFYLLGPSVRSIPDGLEDRFQCNFFKTDFATVASDTFQVVPTDNALQTLCELVNSLRGQPTIIFCKSPKSVNQVAEALVDHDVTDASDELKYAASWLEENFHPEWVLPRAFKKGIGIHHGKLPRSIGHFVVRAFNEKKLDVLACTSTLIEGVNTKAKNIIVFDNSIARQKVDYFTFNNIKGRSGRMFEHFVGQVFLFHEPPAEELPFVDFPVFTQNENMPDSILVQLDEGDLSYRSQTRLEPLTRQSDVPMALIKTHPSIEPTNLINLARYLNNLTTQERAVLDWSGYPRWENLKAVAEISWEYLINRGHGGVLSGAQLAQRVSNLRQKPDVRQRILEELSPGRYAAATVDEAVERVLEFERSWASFEFPRILRAFSDIRRHVHGGSGDYSFFAGELENLFRGPFQMILEEFGIPMQITEKFKRLLQHVNTIDEALRIIKDMHLEGFALTEFEIDIMEDCRQAL